MKWKGREELTSTHPLRSRPFSRLLEGTTPSSLRTWKLNWTVRYPSPSQFEPVSLAFSRFFFVPLPISLFRSGPCGLGISPTYLSHRCLPPSQHRQLRPPLGRKWERRLRSNPTPARRCNPQSSELPGFPLFLSLMGSMDLVPPAFKDGGGCELSFPHFRKKTGRSEKMSSSFFWLPLISPPLPRNLRLQPTGLLDCCYDYAV